MRSEIARTLWSGWSWFVLGVVVVVWTPLVALTRLVTLPFDPGARAAGYLFRKLTVVHEKLTPLWTFRTSGELPPDLRHRPHVIVANHESFVDILLISHLRTEMKWMSKVEIMRIPLVGWMMRLARDIPLERGDRESGQAALEASKERLRSGVSVMIFPEGTRSRSGELRPFHSGAFRLAIEEQVPILPLAVHGTRDALRSDDWRLGRAEAVVRVLDPVPTAGLTESDEPALRRKVRETIAEAREELRRELDETPGAAASPAAG